MRLPSPVPVIVGAGLAGLVTALRLAPTPCVVLSAGPLGQGCASGWAQGGIAAALGADDSPELHAADTLAAGGGLCHPEVVHRVTRSAPAALDYLVRLGARFDRAPDGSLRLGLEGAHSRPRIAHAEGDGTGAELLAAAEAAARATPSIAVVEGARARRILMEDGHVVGVGVERGGRSGHGRRVERVDSGAVVLATGGSGGLWPHTTNPLGARGQGLALAARAGARLRDLEMVQFHPTALDVGLDPMPLVSEAVRGAGALLVDGTGAPLTQDPLAARDVVARAVGTQLARGEQVYLDARGALGPRFATSFPAIDRACRTSGIRPDRDLLPVRPAAHYHCGGVEVDGRGRTTVPGLWAVGEVSSTGLHGANRLASNSLLEAVVCGGWVAEDLRSAMTGGADVAGAAGGPTGLSTPPLETPAGWVPQREAGPLPAVRELMGTVAGLVRDGGSLTTADAMLRQVVQADPGAVDDATLVAFLVIRSCLLRRESRGGHLRVDHPDRTHPQHTTLTLADTLAGPDLPPGAGPTFAHRAGAPKGACAAQPQRPSPVLPGGSR